MAEFTGERLVPELVNADLLNEHLARYLFARRFAAGKRVLDAGCGVGYGAAELATTAAQVTGIDLAPEAIQEANGRYRSHAIEFLEGSCEAMPLGAARFDLVVAFEVIEHLDDWRAFLNECKRVLAPGGQLIVSTPNRDYYAESRKTAGPNPFHRHEFDRAEFHAELSAHFREVKLLAQNHAEGVAIAAPDHGAAGILACASGQPDRADEANFFVALCSDVPQPEPEPFFYLPETGNVLNEREKHIGLLEGELRLKDGLLAERNEEHRLLVENFRRIQSELEERNQWAADRHRESVERGERIAALQAELEERNQWAADRHRESVERGERIAALQEELEEQNKLASDRIAALQEELEERNQWAAQLNQRVTKQGERILALQTELDERSGWAAALQAESDQRVERIVALQNELQESQHQAQATIDELRTDLLERTAWAQRLDQQVFDITHALQAAQHEHATLAAQLEEAVADLSRCNGLLTVAEQTVVERTRWAQEAEQRASEAAAKLALAANSRWLRLGRTVRLGPEL